jgi:hypothetical protein
MGFPGRLVGDDASAVVKLSHCLPKLARTQRRGNYPQRGRQKAGCGCPLARSGFL